MTDPRKLAEEIAYVLDRDYRYGARILPLLERAREEWVGEEYLRLARANCPDCDHEWEGPVLRYCKRHRGVAEEEKRGAEREGRP